MGGKPFTKFVLGIPTKASWDSESTNWPGWEFMTRVTEVKSEEKYHWSTWFPISKQAPKLKTKPMKTKQNTQNVKLTLELLVKSSAESLSLSLGRNSWQQVALGKLAQTAHRTSQSGVQKDDREINKRWNARLSSFVFPIKNHSILALICTSFSCNFCC